MKVTDSLEEAMATGRPFLTVREPGRVARSVHVILEGDNAAQAGHSVVLFRPDDEIPTVCGMTTAGDLNRLGDTRHAIGEKGAMAMAWARREGE